MVEQASHSPSRSPGRDVLHRLYVDERLSVRAIGEMHGVSGKTVSRWLRATGVDARPVGLPKGTRLNITEDHREKLRESLAKARSAITDESRERRAAKLRGRPAHNKGKPMSSEQRALLKEMRQDPEYRRRQSERQKGELSASWRGGMSDASQIHLHGWEWRRRRAECYERDGWRCCDCGVKCVGGKEAHRHPARKIQAHHVIRRRDGGSDDLSNLVTLCASCHKIREQRGDAALFA